MSKTYAIKTDGGKTHYIVATSALMKRHRLAA